MNIHTNGNSRIPARFEALPARDSIQTGGMRHPTGRNGGGVSLRRRRAHGLLMRMLRATRTLHALTAFERRLVAGGRTVRDGEGVVVAPTARPRRQRHRVRRLRCCGRVRFGHPRLLQDRRW